MRAKASGDATLQDIFALIDEVADESIRMGSKRLLIDLTQVRQSFKFTGHFAIGERAALSLGHLEKVASLVAEDRRTGTSEQVARQRGMQLRVFVAEDEAITWLKS
ncbi:MAG: STAS/SEC14 domain-containing protein [Ramlibacter sp.]|nr:STAS/SEC14 domain-containing protein [Ramlibacter sp.]